METSQYEFHQDNEQNSKLTGETQHGDSTIYRQRDNQGNRHRRITKVDWQQHRRESEAKHEALETNGYQNTTESKKQTGK